ncbi:tyrosine-type recombinase/integrase [Castellaniella sp.]|uniref:tyrosine-type recombinase/integrase n=1 Tax=Castellaniella sp. TaxID=1955812 RepID=UPI002AFFBAB3|nr:tyrosine-type recombinase/integrase [Castellaniella sp.]
MLRQMSYDRDAVQSGAQALAVCTLLALRTGMRAGELAGMQWEQVFEDHVHLPQTKSGRPREVPLSIRARRRLRQNFPRGRGAGPVQDLWLDGPEDGNGVLQPARQHPGRAAGVMTCWI